MKYKRLGALISAGAGLLAATAVIAGPAQSARTATYANARYGYVVGYPPDLLVPEREADNGDGRRFHARRGTASMSVWASYNATAQSAAEIVREYSHACQGGGVAYSLAKPHIAAFSCTTPAGRVIYHKTLIRTDLLITVTLEYPNAEHAIWEPVVERVSGSLLAGTPAR